MKISERDELLIQRCVDDELSSAETRALLLRLDEVDSGWRSLACGLLEDRQFRRMSQSPNAFRTTVPDAQETSDNLNSANGSSLTSAVNIAGNKSISVKRWWSHPVTSLTLCAAIAFVGGMLIPDMNPVGAPGAVASTKGNGPVHDAMPANLSPEAYRMELTPDGRKVDVPVYSRIRDLYRQHRDHPLFSQDTLGETQDVQWILVPLEENKSMLIPMSKDRSPEDRVPDFQ